MQVNPKDFTIDSTFVTGMTMFPKHTGIRVTHTPTGISVVSTEERTQHANKDKAFKDLVKIIELMPEPKKFFTIKVTGCENCNHRKFDQHEKWYYCSYVNAQFDRKLQLVEENYEELTTCPMLT